MLDAEAGLHAERRPFLDGEGVLVQFVQRSGLGQVDDDVRTAFDLEAEGEDDAFARVARVGDRGAAADAERLFPFAERFVVLIWRKKGRGFSWGAVKARGRRRRGGREAGSGANVLGLRFPGGPAGAAVVVSRSLT